MPEARLDPADPQAPLFARLDANTLYLSLPSFLGDYRQPLADILEAKGAEIGKAHGLIIDLRGNVGGDAIYFGLAPYLFIGPFQYYEDNLILASPRNLRTLEQIREPLGENGAIFDPAIRRMRENPGKLVPYLDGAMETPPELSPGPRRVVLLVDRGVGSSGEAMILLARQSPRVIVVGENTRGNIDYQQVSLQKVGCGDHAYDLGTPLYTRTRNLPAGGLDVIGITPDVPVPDHLADPLAFAVRLLALP
jgi:C-terminal processing protease CtpA/Prc